MRVGLVLFSVLLSGCVSGLVRPLRVPVIGAPALAHEPLRVTSTDGIALDGWLFEPTDDARGLVVLLHGKDANRQQLAFAAERFVKQGLAVAAYDQRAHGASTGEFVTWGANEVGDLRSMLDTALRRVGRELPVAVIGESLGADVALQAAAADARIRVVVAGAPMADLSAFVEAQTGLLSPSARDAAVRQLEKDARFSVSSVAPARDAARIEVPTLVLHGSEDGVVPRGDALRVYEALRGTRRIVRLEGVGHGVLRSDAAWSEVDQFLREVGFGEPRVLTVSSGNGVVAGQP